MKKRFLKRFSSAVASFAMMMTAVILPAFRVDVFAATKPRETYFCGDLRYTFSDEDYDGAFDTLTIQGYGPMPTFKTSGDDAAPWRVQKNNITSVIIEDGVKSIGANAFYEFTYLEEISVPNSVKSIGKGAFYKCSSLESIKIPYGVDTIENSSFGGCYALESVTIPETVTIIDKMAFCYCLNLKNINFKGNEIEIIEAAAFSGCGFKEFDIPDGVVTVKENAFNGCKNLEAISFPGSVKTIGTKVLSNCPELDEVYFNCKIPLDYDEDWGFDEKYFRKEHTYVSGTCVRCGRDENEKTIEKNDWDIVAADIDLSLNGSTVNVEMNSKDTTVPYEVFRALEGRRIDFVAKTDTGFVWSVNGRDVYSPKKVNLGVKTVKNEIPTSVIRRYSVDDNYKEIELAGSGEFGFKANLTIDVGTENNDKTAVLYYYDEDVNNNALELIETTTVKDGKVTFPFTHASTYMVDIYGEGSGNNEIDDGVIIDFAAGEEIFAEEIIL